MTRFTVSHDEIYGFIVHEASKATSFAMVPTMVAWNFPTKAEALKQAAKLTASPTVIPTRMVETPDRFEAVADTRYGRAW